MSGFDATWLDLREPADRRARDAGLAAAVARHFGGRPQIAVTDLGCGVGATLRALGPHLPAQQRWRLVDHDPALLNALARRLEGGPPAVAWQTHRADLRHDLESVMALPADLVTLSAFLDLVSTAWLERLADAAAAHRRPLYATLVYDGRMTCDPVDPVDAPALRAFNAHQRRDKGFGPAAGPRAAPQAIEILASRGFTVGHANSDWVLEGSDGALQVELIQGWHGAACEQEQHDRPEFDRWRERRLEAVRAGRARLTVGHVDIWACPPTPQALR